jgi:hypothetical protein
VLTPERVRNPWLKFRPADNNILACDRPYVEEFNAYVKRRKLKQGSAIHIRTDLLPEPFFGRFDAPVVLLLQNPGVDKAERERRLHREPQFRRLLVRSLRSKRGQSHFHLRYGEGPGHEWWARAIRPLAHELQTTEVSLASKLLCVEYFPYHSRSFDHRTLRLPSQEFTFRLIRDAIRRNAWILCMRGELEWIGAVPSLSGHERFCVVRGRRVLVSPGAVKCFNDLVEALQ